MTDAAQTQGKEAAKPPGKLLKQWKAVRALASDRSLAGGPLSVWIWIADHSNEKGVAWPGMALLAKETGLDRSSVIRAVGKLERAGYVEVLQRGGLGRSNTYRLTYKGWESERGGTDAGGTDAGSTGATADAPVHQQGGIGASPSVAPMPPYPSHEPEHEARVHGREATSSSGAAGTPPAAAGSPSAPEEEYLEFWQFYPKQQRRYLANELIATHVLKGVPYATIVDGARRYGEYCRAKGWDGDHQFVSMPTVWLTGRRWIDRYSAPREEAATAPQSPAKQPGKGKGAAGAEKGSKAVTAPAKTVPTMDPEKAAKRAASAEKGRETRARKKAAEEVERKVEAAKHEARKKKGAALYKKYLAALDAGELCQVRARFSAAKEIVRLAEEHGVLVWKNRAGRPGLVQRLGEALEVGEDGNSARTMQYWATFEDENVMRVLTDLLPYIPGNGAKIAERTEKARLAREAKEQEERLAREVTARLARELKEDRERMAREVAQVERAWQAEVARLGPLQTGPKRAEVHVPLQIGKPKAVHVPLIINRPADASEQPGASPQLTAHASPHAAPAHSASPEVDAWAGLSAAAGAGPYRVTEIAPIF